MSISTASVKHTGAHSSLAAEAPAHSAQTPAKTPTAKELQMLAELH